MDGVRLRPGSRGVRGPIGAAVVGFSLRLAWSVWATQGPPGHFSDPARYQQIARDFADGRTMSLGGVPSAFWPPGYPLALAPFAWLSEHTGSISLPFAASLVNVAAGTASVVLTGVLASLWIGPSARVIAAWTMAVAPGPIFLTSVALSETLFTAVMLLVLVVTTVAVRRRWSLRRFVVIGVLVGYAVLVRSPGAVLIAAPMLVVLGSRASWRTGTRPTLALIAGVVIAVAPWTVRNGLEVGIWTPVSTNNVAFLCTGNGDGADGTFDDSAATSRRCYLGSPFDNPSVYAVGELPAGVRLSHPDERRWYARTARATTGWMLRHPAAQPRLVGNRLEATFRSEREALTDAEGFAEKPLMGSSPRQRLVGLGNAWFWTVMISAGVGLLCIRRCRRAVPIWGIAGLQVLMLAPGLGIERYHQPIVPLLVILGAGAAARLRRLAPDEDVPSATAGEAAEIEAAGPRHAKASAR